MNISESHARPPKDRLKWAALAFAIAAFAGGGLLGHYVWRVKGQFDDQDLLRAKYVLIFGDGIHRVRVKPQSRQAFRDAISQPRWRTGVSMTKDPDDASTIDETFNDNGGNDPNAKIVSRAVITQRNKTNSLCTLHVTQKVGLNTEDEVKAILSTLNPN